MYWTSIGLLVLMLAFTGWYFYQSRDAICQNSISDPLIREELQRYWQQARIIALLAEGEDSQQLAAGLQSLLSANYKLYASTPDLVSELGKPQMLSWLVDCDAGMLARAARLDPDNQLLLLWANACAAW